MNGDPEQPDPLDELLAKATWPQIVPESTARMRAQWAAISPARRRRWLAWSLSSAAAVTVAVGVFFSINSRPPHVEVTTLPTTHSVTTVVHVTYPSRELTRRDELLLKMAELRSGETTPIARVQDHTQLALELRERVLRGEPGAAQTMLDVKTPPAVRREVIDALFAQLEDRNIDTRLVAARVLAAIDGPETVARLGSMIQHNVSRREALAALIWCSRHSPDAQRLLDDARRSPRLASSIRAIELNL